jgi:glycerol-3-phosphate cytidylyltransferase
MSKIIGYTTGVFDLFHIGHLNILKKAKEQCDYLIVGVSTDELVQSYKNKTPVIPFKERVAIVEAIRYVDRVIAQETLDKMSVWNELHFDIMFHGSEWKGTELYNQYEKKFAEVGCKIVYLSHTKGISSSMITNKINNALEIYNCENSHEINI